jgi:DNA-binding LacI/PurR family transcriptional regulator
MRSIGLLVPQPLHQLQPYATVFIDPLRTLLYENGFRLDTHFGRSFFSRKPAAALKRLVARFPCDGWLLAVSNRPCQAWFQAQGIATVVIGSSHEDIALPCVDLDMLATSRHGAQVLLRKGHRRIALVIGASEWVGDRKTEQGFLEGVRQFGSGAVGQVFKHAGTFVALRQTVTHLLQASGPPTALLVVNPYTYLTVAGILAEKGLQVPRDMSLLCRDDEYCFRHLPIAPSRYVYDQNARAKVIFSTLMAAMEPGRRKTSGAQGVLILPNFHDGASIAQHARDSAGNE